MIMNSVVQFLFIKSMIYILNLMHSTIDLNYDYQGGLTSVLFTMFTIYFSFKINSRKQIKCEKLKFFYRSINTKNIIMVNVLNELQNNSMNDNYNYENDFNDIVPRTNEASNNINNNGNDEQ